MSHGDFVNLNNNMRLFMQLGWHNGGTWLLIHVVTASRGQEALAAGQRIKKKKKKLSPDKELSTRFLLLQAEIHDSFSAGLMKNGLATCLSLYQHECVLSRCSFQKFLCQTTPTSLQQPGDTVEKQRVSTRAIPWKLRTLEKSREWNLFTS